MTTSIQFGSKQINFRVVYSNRKTLGIKVTPELDVLVNANPICKHVAKAPQANAKFKALSKSLQSRPN